MMNVDLEALPVGEDAPEMVNVVVEIPVGSRNKYEYEPEMGGSRGTACCQAASATRPTTGSSPRR